MQSKLDILRLGSSVVSCCAVLGSVFIDGLDDLRSSEDLTCSRVAVRRAVGDSFLISAAGLTASSLPSRSALNRLLEDEDSGVLGTVIFSSMTESVVVSIVEKTERTYTCTDSDGELMLGEQAQRVLLNEGFECPYYNKEYQNSEEIMRRN